MTLQLAHLVPPYFHFFISQVDAVSSIPDFGGDSKDSVGAILIVLLFMGPIGTYQP